MPGEILTDPIQMQTDLDGVFGVPVIVQAATWTQILKPDPQRQAFYLQPLSSVTPFTVVPNPTGSPPAGIATVGTGLLVYHSAVYLSLTQGSWWVYSPNLQTVIVWDVIRQR